jgi:hypothetical protein
MISLTHCFLMKNRLLMRRSGAFSMQNSLDFKCLYRSRDGARNR